MGEGGCNKQKKNEKGKNPEDSSEKPTKDNFTLLIAKGHSTRAGDKAKIGNSKLPKPH